MTKGDYLREYHLLTRDTAQQIGRIKLTRPTTNMTRLR